MLNLNILFCLRHVPTSTLPQSSSHSTYTCSIIPKTLINRNKSKKTCTEMYLGTDLYVEVRRRNRAVNKWGNLSCYGKLFVTTMIDSFLLHHLTFYTHTPMRNQCWRKETMVWIFLYCNWNDTRDLILYLRITSELLINTLLISCCLETLYHLVIE